MHGQPFRAERPASSKGGVDVPPLDKEAVFMILYEENEVLTSLRSSEAHR